MLTTAMHMARTAVPEVSGRKSYLKAGTFLGLDFPSFGAALKWPRSTMQIYLSGWAPELPEITTGQVIMDHLIDIWKLKRMKIP